jgi:hypothetical protein
MFETPEDNPIETQDSSEATLPDENKAYRIALYVLGVLFIGAILWGVFQIKSATDSLTMQMTEESVVAPVTQTPPSEETQQEMVEKQLEILAAESVNQEPMSGEEVQAQLDTLATESETKPLTQEEVEAQLEELSAQGAN